MSSSVLMSSFSPQGYGSQARVSSFNPYCRHRVHFTSPSCCDSYSKSHGVRTMRISNKSVRKITMSISDESVSKIPSPWLMLPPAFGGNNMTYKFYSLAENEVLSFTKTKDGDRKEIIYKYFRTAYGSEYELETEDMPDHDADVVGSSHGWLAFFNRSDWNMFLSDPVSRRSIKLPPLDTLPRPGCPFRYIKNVVLSCSPGDECRAVMIYGPQNRLAFCCPGRGPEWDLEWTPIGKVYYLTHSCTRIPRAYQSVVYSSRQKLFFSVTKSLEFEAWDLSDPMSPCRISMDDVQVEDGKSQLAMEAYVEKDKAGLIMEDHQILVVAEHSDELFLVRQFVMYRMGADGLPVERIYYGPIKGYSKDDVPYKTIGFDVHRYDPVDRAFKYIDTCTGGGVHEYDPEMKALKYTAGGGGGGSSLDGLALFVGLNHGFAVRADEYPGLKPNSIYFTDRHYTRRWCTEDGDGNKVERDFGGHDIGIFNYEDGTFSPCYFPCDYESIQKIRPAPMWFTPNPPL